MDLSPYKTGLPTLMTALLVGTTTVVLCALRAKWGRRSKRSQRETVVMFSRYPEAGKTKTRLIPALGEAGALRTHLHMVCAMFKCLKELNEKRRELCVVLSYSGGTESQIAYWLNRRQKKFSNLSWKRQEGVDLGERMRNAVQDCFDMGEDRVVIIGSDIPGITQDILYEALEKLEDNEMVLGPAADGGYYLVGMSRKCEQHLGLMFRGMEWGTERVFDQQVAVAEQLGVHPVVLDTLQDVDVADDLSVLKDVLGLDTCQLSSPRISIIMPALNEAANIEKTVRTVRKNCHQVSQLELVVSDGGSNDGTSEKVRALQSSGDLQIALVQSGRGRGKQCRAGVAAARGDIFLFLHADTQLPQDYDLRILDVLATPGVSGGAFDFGLDVLHEPVAVARAKKTQSYLFSQQMRFLEWLVYRRSRKLELPYGDQALFMTRESYTEAGGIPDFKLMEDFILLKNLQEIGHIKIADGPPCLTSARRLEKHGFKVKNLQEIGHIKIADGPPCLTSARRMEKHGFKITLLNFLFVTAYKLGVHPNTLGDWYYSYKR